MQGRLRWFQVKVQTDEGAYVGSLRLAGRRSALSELLDDGRVYLTLWEATRDGMPVAQGFVAIHKAAIRCVVVIGDGERPAPPMEARA
jgi:hypothetical protein